jgi:hypothetical protein
VAVAVHQQLVETQRQVLLATVATELRHLSQGLLSPTQGVAVAVLTAVELLQELVERAAVAQAV